MTSELLRLMDGPYSGERPAHGFLAIIDVRGESAEASVTGAKQVLSCVLGLSVEQLETPVAAALLPSWFVQACAPEESEAERARWLQWWRQLDDADRARAADARTWTLDDWLFWMRPEERQWYWWDSQILAPDHGQVLIKVTDWPTAVGSLVWLLRAGGARNVSMDIADSPMG